MYQELKLQLLEIVGLSRDAMHIYIGLLVFFLTVLTLRGGRMDPLALFPVLLIACAMEAMDLFDTYTAMATMQWGHSVHDLFNTLFWPIIIVLLVKLRRILPSET